MDSSERVVATIDELESSAVDKTKAKKLQGQKKTETPIDRIRVGDGGEPVPEPDPSCFWTARRSASQPAVGTRLS